MPAAPTAAGLLSAQSRLLIISQRRHACPLHACALARAGTWRLLSMRQQWHQSGPRILVSTQYMCRCGGLMSSAQGI